MQVVHTTLVIETRKAVDIQDLTEKVKMVVAQSGIQNGVVTVFVRHTTAIVRINEWEAGFLEDLQKMLEQLVPLSGDYQHNELACRSPESMRSTEECLNGHAHLQQIFAGNTSESIPLQDGKLLLGTWQSILLIELSDPRQREVIISIIGE